MTFTLTKSGRGMLLRFEQVGFSADREQAYRGGPFGWQKYLSHVESLPSKKA